MSDLLPNGWEGNVMAAAAEADFRMFQRTPPVTRESADVTHIERGRVHADQVQLLLPWLHDLYHGAFLDLANQAWNESVVAANDDRYGIVLNVQRGPSMRFECHVDSNPLTGLLFLTNHQLGGELAIARRSTASGMAAIDKDCLVIRPQAGQLLFFDARRHPHYARPLTGASDVRVIAAMNFYTESFPEATRPSELNRHLYGDPA